MKSWKIRFFEDIIKKEFPHLKLEFDNTNKRLVYIKDNTIVFSSKKLFDNSPISYIISALAHEYVHFKQRQQDRLHKVKYLFPGNIYVFCVIILICLLHMWYFLPVLFFIFPIFPYWKIRKELEAYKMSILVELTIINNGHYKIPEYLHTRVDEIINTMFSSVYNLQYVPFFMKRRYFKELLQWAYKVEDFNILFDIDKKISYIIGDDNLDMYSKVMLYLIRNKITNN